MFLTCHPCLDMTLIIVYLGKQTTPLNALSLDVSLMAASYALGVASVKFLYIITLVGRPSSSSKPKRRSDRQASGEMCQETSGRQGSSKSSRNTRSPAV